VRAMVGGYDFFRSEFNRAVQARRQPGSAFKPFVYIAALEAGFTPASRVEDAPVSYAVGPKGEAWKPDNYDRKYRGPTTLQQAVEESVNIVTVKVQERVGLGKTIQVARRFGIASPLHMNLSLALGTSDLTLLELTSAYGVLANQGEWLTPTTIRYVTDAQGKLLEEHVAEPREAVPPEIAYVMTHMLRGVVERGTGVAAKALGRPWRRRRARRTTTRTRGSWVSRRGWPRASGSATTGHAASGRTRLAPGWRFRSGSRTWERYSVTARAKIFRCPTRSSSCPWTSIRPTNVCASSRWRS